MRKLIKGFSQVTKAIAGGLLAAIFLTFLLQILLRYFLHQLVGHWSSSEFCGFG
jgi:TRAP-type C4-dicarboxylate transport system permease small subunit